jgi:hypothetical protein
MLPTNDAYISFSKRHDARHNNTQHNDAQRNIKKIQRKAQKTIRTAKHGSQGHSAF